MILLFKTKYLYTILIFIECKEELHKINQKILIIDESINPIKINLSEIKNQLIGVTEKMLCKFKIKIFIS